MLAVAVLVLAVSAYVLRERRRNDSDPSEDDARDEEEAASG